MAMGQVDGIYRGPNGQLDPILQLSIPRHDWGTGQNLRSKTYIVLRPISNSKQFDLCRVW